MGNADEPSPSRSDAVREKNVGRYATIQPEAMLEAELIERLVGLGYERVVIADEAALLVNLKKQFEKHNGVTLSGAEFDRVVNHLDKGNVFDRVKTLRDRFHLTRDDGTSTYIQFMNTDHWCRNSIK